jgi:hypothetical protein
LAAVAAVVVDAVVVDAVVVDAVVVVEVDLFNSPGAFKIVIFAGSNSVSSFGFAGDNVGAWKNSWKLAVKLFV